MCVEGCRDMCVVRGVAICVVKSVAIYVTLRMLGGDGDLTRDDVCVGGCEDIPHLSNPSIVD